MHLFLDLIHSSLNKAKSKKMMSSSFFNDPDLIKEVIIKIYKIN